MAPDIKDCHIPDVWKLRFFLTSDVNSRNERAASEIRPLRAEMIQGNR